MTSRVLRVFAKLQELGWPLAIQLVMQMDQCSLQSDRSGWSQK